ncbi:DUF262 domain-containing protein [Nocardia sp. A7]|uniref:GmrSD restriction endonuclease domain-containing protein n=1 Tax=Nocardia sp. A7 TaxID=2789274 RepID=UPI00397D46CA
MSSFITSYAALFIDTGHDGTTAVKWVEIPLIQRDYAQGREDSATAEIRADFLDVLCDAVTGFGSVSLDFVYGDIRDGTLRPLDGQQRLTTLFLLHWYIAFRTESLTADLAWTRFRYATRPSAELFCERIVANPPPSTVTNPSAWIMEQSWYLYTWRHDPTIQAMLVMIHALDERLHDIDFTSAWARLVSESAPAICFHVLPIQEMGAGDELYIKMNSRGKPLTPFENFKARFEKALEGSHRAEEFADRVDGVWSDVLWRYRGRDDIVDEKFVRYFSFVTEVTEWRNGNLGHGRLEPRAEHVFGTAAPNAPDNLDFLFGAFDAWVATDPEEVFADLITVTPAKADSVVRFFGTRRVDHFRECCNTYELGSQRSFSLSETLTLYAVLLHRIHASKDFARRLRVLRNLLEASTNEVRVENMPALIRAVTCLVTVESLTEALQHLSAFNEAQIDDERAKAAFLGTHPELSEVVFGLEDHRLLRGSLVAFELDAKRLADRAHCFEALMGDRRLWPALTAALLATGDYSRTRQSRSFRFGSPEEDRWWRELLTGAKRSTLRGIAEVTARVLDTLSASDEGLPDALKQIRRSWLSEQDSYDWRYYLVKYAVMRNGKSGIYVAEGGRMGFSLCMLDKTQLNSWYRDPYLDAVQRTADVRNALESFLYTGYETNPRWMRLRISGIRIRCIRDGFMLEPPTDPNHRELYLTTCEDFEIGQNNLLVIPQITRDGVKVDTKDRVERCSQLVRALVAAGL